MKHLPLLIFLCIAMAGCRTQYVPVETVRSEYKDRIRETYTVDSVTDTRLVYVKGDTVIDWRDRVKWRDREIHDSIYINKTDTIRIPYPLERIVEVKRKPAWWEKTMEIIGLITTVLILACFSYILLHKKKF